MYFDVHRGEYTILYSDEILLCRTGCVQPGRDSASEGPGLEEGARRPPPAVITQQPAASTLAISIAISVADNASAPRTRRRGVVGEPCFGIVSVLE